MNGIQFLEKLLPARRRPQLPVIILTAQPDEKRIARAYALGAAGFIHKPLNLPQNLQKLQNYLDLLQLPLRVWPIAGVRGTEVLLPRGESL